MILNFFVLVRVRRSRLVMDLSNSHVQYLFGCLTKQAIDGLLVDFVIV